MSRVDVVGTGYAGASEILQDANQVAALRHQLLASDLHGYGAMAGDSSFAEGFASSYDEGAAAVLAGLGEAVHALAVSGQMCFASLENHSRAELASHLSAPSAWPTVEFDRGRWYEAEPAAIPSVLGGDLEGLPGWASFILDHVEGFAWPDADLDRLRAAAADWHTHAEAVAHLASYPDRASTRLSEERSPEVTQAVEVVSRVGTAVADIAAQMHVIGDSCSGYADAVETHREEILALVRDLIRDALIIEGVGMILSTVTFGGAGAGATAVNVAKISAETPRFMLILESLRAASLNYSLAMSSGTSVVESAVVRLERFRSARIARGIVKDERGSIDLSGFLGKGWSGSTYRDLSEYGRGHVLREHVGKTYDDLLTRLAKDPRKKYVSSFYDERSAETGIEAVLSRSKDDVFTWLRGTENVRSFEVPVSADLGLVVARGGQVVPSSTVRVVLIRDECQPESFQVLTAYLNP